MTRTPDEIKKGLECCLDHVFCAGAGCLYYKEQSEYCDLMSDALALIRWHEEKNEAMHAEIVRLQAERDAAVADLKSYRCCHGCKHLGVGFNEPCLHCDFENNCFEWRGVQKEGGAEDGT